MAVVDWGLIMAAGARTRANRSGRNRMCRAVLMGMLISQGELMTLAVGCLTSAA
jgi:hypothetical protein